MKESVYSGKITKFHPTMFFKPVVILILFLISVLYTATTHANNQEINSPYFGWFKGKTQFSFVAKTITTGKVAGMQTEMTVTSTYVVKNGVEGVKEVTVMKLNGKAQQPTEKIYLTSAEANYVINPESKMFFQDKGDYGSFKWSKVWQFTRKRSDSYESISKNGKAAPGKVNDIPVTCYSIQGITFCFNAEKQLLKYEGDAGSMHVQVILSEYKDTNVDDFFAGYINAVRAGEYKKADDMFSL